MKIGLLSDTHDNLPQVEKAIKILNQTKTELVLHAGDYTSPFVIPKFKNLNCKLIGVFGNNDGDHECLKQRFNETNNCTIKGKFAEINVDNCRIALLHGEEIELLNALANSQYFDAIVCGHSHAKKIEQKAKTLVINPGEICGYLTGKSTLAILDTIKRQAEIMEL